MGLTQYVVLALAIGAPQVEISTLSGEQHTGQLVELTPKSLSLSEDAGDRKFSVADLLEVRFPAAESQRHITNQAAHIRLADGSQFTCTEVTTSARDVNVVGTHIGKLHLSPSAVVSLRFAPADDRVDADWQKLCSKELKRDLLVIRKGDVLDYQDGTIGDIDEKKVNFVLDGDEFGIKRDRVFGIVYARRKPSRVKPLCRIVMGKRNELFVRSVVWDGKTAKATLLSGEPVELSSAAFQLLDFSLGKVLYLSQMDPRDVKYTPFFDITWEYRRDRNLDGGPIRVGKKEYRRGLSIHSRTYLRYRLGGEFRRFQTVMGIDHVVGRKGDVHVVISVDGEPLLETDVRGTDAPRVLDLDVAGARDLEILVDFGGDLDIADHLDLADARVIK